MIKFAEHFGLPLEQPELDFVNVPLDSDLSVYLDPFAISLYHDTFSRQCNDAVVAFFQAAISAISSGDNSRAERMLQHLSEPNETRLGVSSGVPRGRGVGHKQAVELYKSVAANTSRVRQQRPDACQGMQPALAEGAAIDLGFLHLGIVGCSPRAVSATTARPSG
jgi:hypothetical protein